MAKHAFARRNLDVAAIDNLAVGIACGGTREANKALDKLMGIAIKRDTSGDEILIPEVVERLKVDSRLDPQFAKSLQTMLRLRGSYTISRTSPEIVSAALALSGRKHSKGKIAQLK